IPRHTVCEVVLEKEKKDTFKELLLEIEDKIKKELASKDKDFQITAVFTGEAHTVCADEKSTKQAAAFLAALPNGVQAMSADVEGLVETSLNLGMVSYTAGSKELRCTFSLRSCIESAKQALMEKVEAVTLLAGGSCDVSGDYPGWAYRVHSPLRDKMVALYEEMYGEKPRLEAIHAGLECGILAAKLKDLDCISFGPDMENIHTTEETLSVSSVARVWDYLVRLLAQKNI
ncbi:MAG: M20/M25/M40 family metallo-hydrolase, partial [Lachnospiraceae bacterium]|nr:M20/M25/M40 family metallo-hydrolase [Lachnospiraceae bacterium]